MKRTEMSFFGNVCQSLKDIKVKRSKALVKLKMQQLQIFPTRTPTIIILGVIHIGRGLEMKISS